MDMDFWYRTLPFVSLALVLSGWALTDILLTPRDDIDGMSLTIWFAGLAGSLYLISLALNFAPIDLEWKQGWFEAIRIALLLTIPGVPIVWINVGRAFRARKAGRLRSKRIPEVK